jgi:hypothetical protein
MNVSTAVFIAAVFAVTEIVSLDSVRAVTDRPVTP